MHGLSIIQNSPVDSIISTTRNESDLLETFKLFDSTNNTLKTIPYASASLGINGIFIGGFIIYLVFFLLFVLIVKFQNYTSCQSDNEDQSEGPPSHMKNSARNHDQSQPTTPSNMFPSVSPSTPKGNSKPHQKQKMNRNQKIMLLMVCFLVFIQLIALCTRIVADSLAIVLRTEFYSIYGKIIEGFNVDDAIIDNFYRKLTIFHIFVSADFGFTKGNFITVLVILNFIQQVL
ncbi:predicted protein [Naegleria gruberi]|uniref:Predicted protein n=1 Tax=Naegleria gruberi TaxID=5762 RepID=D2VFT5_NAEGR|nr:uncharacterized protein NAEGRDRAFT_67737 [Naegleria gruberi]EFC44246.1 predicted protein [Naegleria gruberi]|eukprot:XP_002676990.1 predicted protein [Naegleria gruberi strain NEG-M]